MRSNSVNDGGLVFVNFGRVFHRRKRPVVSPAKSLGVRQKPSKEEKKPELRTAKPRGGGGVHAAWEGEVICAESGLQLGD